MKIYLAAPFATQEYMRSIQTQIEKYDPRLEVNASWIHFDDPHTQDPAVFKQEALNDLGDLRRSKVMLNFTGLGTSTGGRHFELGYALYHRKVKLYLIGPREHVFHYLDDNITYFAEWGTPVLAELVNQIEGERNG